MVCVLMIASSTVEAVELTSLLSYQTISVASALAGKTVSFFLMMGMNVSLYCYLFDGEHFRLFFEKSLAFVYEFGCYQSPMILFGKHCTLDFRFSNAHLPRYFSYLFCELARISKYISKQLSFCALRICI